MAGQTNNAINLRDTGVVTYDGSGGFTGSLLTQHDVLVGGSTNDIISVSPSTAGFVLTSNGVSADPSFQAPALVDFPYTVLTADAPLLNNNGYFINGAGVLNLTLPVTAAVGDAIVIDGLNSANGWALTYGTGQSILFGTATSTVTSGSISSTLPSDCMRLVCYVADTTWVVETSQGNPFVS